jgi:hypothetical protein
MSNGKETIDGDNSSLNSICSVGFYLVIEEFKFARILILEQVVLLYWQQNVVIKNTCFLSQAHWDLSPWHFLVL